MTVSLWPDFLFLDFHCTTSLNRTIGDNSTEMQMEVVLLLIGFLLIFRKVTADAAAPTFRVEVCSACHSYSIVNQDDRVLFHGGDIAVYMQGVGVLPLQSRRHQ